MCDYDTTCIPHVSVCMDLCDISAWNLASDSAIGRGRGRERDGERERGRVVTHNTDEIFKTDVYNPMQNALHSLSTFTLALCIG